MFVPFAEFRPDVAAVNADFTDNVLNVLPSSGFYSPFPSLVPVSQTLPSAPAGNGILARTLNGGLSIFVGTGSKLWRLNNTTLAWIDVSRTGAAYSANPDAPWDFAQYGSFVVAVNGNDDPQVFDMTSAVRFTALGGSPPRASIVKVWGDFLALMGLTSNPDRAQWSGLNDIEQWTPGTNNSDYQTFPDGGRVQGSTEGTNPLIILERAIYSATFVPGSDEVFSFSKAQDKRGAKSPSSIASRGAYTFYVDEGGFFQLASDGSVNPIGFMKVDQTAFASIIASDVAKMAAVVDPIQSRVYWAAPYSGSPFYNRLLIYDWQLQQWSQAEVSILSLFNFATTGFTMESLDTVSTNLDALPFSLDSRVWQGGAPLLGAFSTDFRLSAFNGGVAEAILETQEMGDTTGGITTHLSHYPAINTGACFGSVGSRYRQSDTPAFTEERAMSGNTGRIHKRSRGKFHRVRIRIPASTTWSRAQGVDVETVTTGRR